MNAVAAKEVVVPFSNAETGEVLGLGEHAYQYWKVGKNGHIYIERGEKYFEVALSGEEKEISRREYEHAGPPWAKFSLQLINTSLEIVQHGVRRLIHLGFFEELRTGPLGGYLRKGSKFSLVLVK